MHNDENTVAIVARLFLRGKTFMNWPIPTFQRGNIMNCQDNLRVKSNFHKQQLNQIHRICEYFPLEKPAIW